mmetsp:Transcript_29222/g.85682  ORF Transcript_29222/g.85682 Transcript_29222/m.85682 type:complete len:351 (-) Transcript_29222:96-1148(-)
MASLVDSLTSGSLALLRGRLGPPPASASAPLLLFTHGSGFNAGTWLAAIEKLHGAREVASMECAAFDWTGHGRSRDVPGSGVSASRYDWPRISRQDIPEVLEAVGARGRPIYGVGHSFGAAALTLAELQFPGTFAGLVLIEPIIRAQWPTGEHPLVKRTLQRRAVFDVASREEIAAHFGQRAFGRWHASALRGYVDRGFRPRAEGLGGFELACTPEVEACVYEGGMQCRVFDDLPRLTCPTIVAAGENSTTLTTQTSSHAEQLALVADRVPGCTEPVAVAKGCGHAVPMEAPEWTAHLVASFVQSVSPGPGGGGVPHAVPAASGPGERQLASASAADSLHGGNGGPRSRL